MNKSLIGILCGLGAASIWGGMYVVSKVVLDIIPPFTLVSIRLILGSITLMILCALRGWSPLSIKHFWQVFWTGFIGYGISLGFQFEGTKLSTAANGSLVTSATPAFIFLFAWLLLREGVTSRKVLALLLSTFGVIAVIDPRNAELNPGLFWGNLFLLAAALTWALYSVLVRKLTHHLDVLTVSLIAFTGGLPLTLPISFWELNRSGVGSINFGIVAGVLFLGIISTGLAMLLWNNSFAILNAGIASLTFFAQPVVGSLLGYFFLKETLTPLFLIGGIFIGVGLIIASTEP